MYYLGKSNITDNVLDGNNINITTGANKFNCIFGDLNIAHRLEDGVFDNGFSRSFTKKKRELLCNFSQKHSLADIYPNFGELYTYEGNNRKRIFKFRSDLALISQNSLNYYIPAVSYLHCTRKGPMVFTDHSGVFCSLLILQILVKFP